MSSEFPVEGVEMTLLLVVEDIVRSRTEVPPVAVPLPMLDLEPSVVPGVGAS